VGNERGTTSVDISDAELEELATARAPEIEGHSKRIWRLGGGLCYVRMIPSLHSFTYQRSAIMEETGSQRLDFYVRTAGRLSEAGVPHAFIRRVDATSYLARYVPAPPFEVIVKNRAVGSTVRKYPGLFEENAPLPRPIVKFDYRIDPEDQPIGEDYLRALDLPVDAMRQLALEINDLLRGWLAPLELWDFCLIFGLAEDRQPVLISEVSPDCMRLRTAGGESLDKDLFRHGASADEITQAWKRLLDGLG
jgi:phosphoribosylaminoimidazole-succinocarboxamide synthase